jgi:hypothetical protein
MARRPLISPYLCWATSGPNHVVLAGRALYVPKQQLPAVASGQPRSVAMAPDPRQRRIAASPTLLPKLAVAWWLWSVLGPHGVGNRWSSAGTSGQRRQISIAGQRASIVSTSARRNSPALGSNPTSSASATSMVKTLPALPDGRS